MKYILSLLAACLLNTACEPPKTYCGTIKSKWQSGRFNDHYMMCVVDENGPHTVEAPSRDYWGSHVVGENGCGQ